MRLLGRTRRKRYAALSAVALATLVAASTAWTPANAAENPPPSQRDWQNKIAQVPQPTKVCFPAESPDLTWHPATCAVAPNLPQPPRHGARPLVVGNGDDVAAQVPTGFIATAIGSFDSVVNVSSESGPIGNAGPAVANAYTLQMNTNFFASTACAGSPNAGCQGWEQFVYANDGSSGVAFIQYWLIKYNAACPGGVGWNQFSFTGSTDIYCWKNNTGGAGAGPNQPITNLRNLSLTRHARGGGGNGTPFSRAPGQPEGCDH